MGRYYSILSLADSIFIKGTHKAHKSVYKQNAVHANSHNIFCDRETAWTARYTMLLRKTISETKVSVFGKASQKSSKLIKVSDLVPNELNYRASRMQSSLLELLSRSR